MKPLTLTSMKLKTLLHTFIFFRIARAFNRIKTLVIHVFKDAHFLLDFPLKSTKKQKQKQKQKQKLFFGSFRLYYNWCSSHTVRVQEYYHNPNICCEYSSWRFDCAELQECSNELSSYLQWLEEKGTVEDDAGDLNHEIDRLADMFIANCHEKFRLEKQESYRRFQEMMARSIC